MLIERENPGSIFTCIVSVEEHPNPSVTVKKYSIVAVGEANGFSTDGSLRSVTGVQEVIPTADTPFNCTLSPKQIDVSLPASTKGSGLTVTITESASAHPKAFVPVIMYSVVGREYEGVLNVYISNRVSRAPEISCCSRSI